MVVAFPECDGDMFMTLEFTLRPELLRPGAQEELSSGLDAKDGRRF